MVNKKVELSRNVVDMARLRIENIFRNGYPVYLSMSGGKDSIVLAHLTYSLIQEGRVNPEQLTVQFVDEEAMHEEVIRVTRDWRKRFLSVGAKFDWWCIEVKHFNCFNQLTQDESFICWDREAKDVWVRPMPKFAKTSHPLLRPRVDTYQEFLTRITPDGISITGVRTAESVQRLQAFRNKEVGKRKILKPIYDWKDTDVWRYIKEEGLDFPETYLHLYQVGQSRREMRLSQFFSIDTAKTLVRLGEYDPGLMERVTRREPNAYLAALYWDSEMFRGKKDRAIAEKSGKVEEKLDYQAETIRLLKSVDKGVRSPNKETSSLARHVRAMLLSGGAIFSERIWRDAYHILVGGDPKRRSVRALYVTMGADLGDKARKAKEQ